MNGFSCVKCGATTLVEIKKTITESTVLTKLAGELHFTQPKELECETHFQCEKCWEPVMDQGAMIRDRDELFEFLK